ncbi:hypothetical protein WCD74_05450 [Actinomycetospora sp. OC33-EN08]|uniref:Uncharacterized protein n=1 Tax=Actinomycetospora aurantiaca TaxID=3129233 RepID=A0ABU8MJR5_9PSEU
MVLSERAGAPPAEKGGMLSGVRVTGGAFAATTTAAAGGFLGGAAGTVVGAAVASVVTTVGEAVYQRSLERTRDHVRGRLDARRGPAPAPTAVLPDGPPPDDSPTTVIKPVGAARSRAKIAALVASGLLVFLVAMVVVTGIERVKGSPLSGGTGTSVGEVIGTAPTTSASAAEDTDGNESGATTTTTAPERSTTTSAPSRTTTSRSREPATTTTLEPPAN